MVSNPVLAPRLGNEKVLSFHSPYVANKALKNGLVSPFNYQSLLESLVIAHYQLGINLFD